MPHGSFLRTLNGDVVGRIEANAVTWLRAGVNYGLIVLPAVASATSCHANAIGDDDRVAGNCETPIGTRGVVWLRSGSQAGLLAELQPAPGHAESTVWGMNSAGQVVGSSDLSPALWTTVALVPSLGVPGLASLVLVFAVIAALRSQRGDDPAPGVDTLE